MDKYILDEKIKLLSEDYTPKYEQLIVHPEEGETFEYNKTMNNIRSDINFINDYLVNKSTDLTYLLQSSIERLDAINNVIIDETERLQDIKMLCNKFTDFDKCIPIDKVNTYGNNTYKGGTLSCLISRNKSVNLKVAAISGNGIEGNKYVYNDYKYIQDALDTSVRDNITDKQFSSYYEYERITASPQEDYLIQDFNLDNEDARCTITLYCEKDYINLLSLETGATNVIVTGVQYSNDGITFTDLAIPDIVLNDKTKVYSNCDYVYGDNKILVPSSKYVKISLQSKGITDDTIAYDRKVFKIEGDPEDKIYVGHTLIEKTTDDDGNEVQKSNYYIDGYLGGDDYTVPKYNIISEETVLIESAQRHCIQINDINGYSNEYNRSCFLQTDELIETNEKFYSAAVFANVYIPKDITENDIKFYLILNGTEYEIKPINSQGNGKKVLRYSKGKSKNAYTTYLSEPIVSASLKIVMNGTVTKTPLVNNIKVLLGGEI